jgi:hypothetical protein
MRRIGRAVWFFLATGLTWRTCWRLTAHRPVYHMVARDGFLYIEPRIGR